MDALTFWRWGSLRGLWAVVWRGDRLGGCDDFQNQTQIDPAAAVFLVGVALRFPVDDDAWPASGRDRDPIWMTDQMRSAVDESKLEGAEGLRGESFADWVGGRHGV